MVSGRIEVTNDDDVRAGKLSLLDPRTKCHKYFFGIFMCLVSLGSYFAYESPTPLQEEIKRSLTVDTAQVALLYTIPGYVNVVTSFVGGFLVDRYFGFSWGAVICCMFLLAGQAVVGLGALSGSILVMYSGRFLFAFGGEVLVVTNNLRAVKWFSGKQLNMIFGIQLSVARAGGTISISTMAHVYGLIDKHLPGNTRLGYAFLIAGFGIVFDLILTIVLLLREQWADRVMDRSPKPISERTSPKDLKRMNAKFWLLILIMMTYFNAIYILITFGITFYQRKYQLTQVQADLLDSLVYFISIFLTPLSGWLTGKTGRSLSWVLLASLLTGFAHVCLTFFFWTPWLAVAILGVGFSIFSCVIWPMVSMVVPEQQLGTAFGIGQASLNLGYALATWITGLLVDRKGYFVVQLFYIIWVLASLVFIFLLFVVDQNDNTLNDSAERKNQSESKQALDKDL